MMVKRVKIDPFDLYDPFDKPPLNLQKDFYVPTYQQTIDYLFTRLPMFSRIGAAAYKEDLYQYDCPLRTSWTIPSGNSNAYMWQVPMARALSAICWLRYCKQQVTKQDCTLLHT